MIDIDYNVKTVGFTSEFTYSAADFDDLGESGVINESLKILFADSTFEANGNEYDIERFVSVEVKVKPERNGVTVLLYGQAEVIGL